MWANGGRVVVQGGVGAESDGEVGWARRSARSDEEERGDLQRPSLVRDGAVELR